MVRIRRFRRTASLNIQNITTDYVFSLRDEDKILHFKHENEGVKVHLPDPQAHGMKSGTQFFVHNISNNWIEFEVDSGINFHARAKYLRKNMMMPLYIPMDTSGLQQVICLNKKYF